MRKLLVVLVALFAIVGCAHESTPISGTVSAGPQMFGTIAPFGSFEMQLAPAYTRLAVLRHNAARALAGGRISVATAQSVQDKADMARIQLDAAHSATLDGKERPEAKQALVDATEWIKQAETALEISK